MHREAPLQVVLADPDARDRERIKRLTSMYTSGRYEFQETSTGQETLRVIRDQPTDCLLLSDPLPDMNAAQVVGSIDSRREPLATIVLATSKTDSFAGDAGSTAVASYLEKRELTAHAISSALQGAFAQVERLRLERKQRELEAAQRELEAARERERREAEERRLAAVRVHNRSLLTPLDIPLSWSLGGRWRDAVVCGLSTVGARIEDVSALPPEGAVLEISLELLQGVDPLQVRGEVVRLTDSGGFEVAFRGLGRRDKGLLRNAASRGRRSTKNKPS